MKFRAAHFDRKATVEPRSVVLFAVGVVPDHLADGFSLFGSEGVILEEFKVVVFKADGLTVFGLVPEEHDEVFKSAGFSGDEFFVEVRIEDSVGKTEASIGIRESHRARDRTFFVEATLLPFLTLREFEILILLVVFDEVGGKRHGGVGDC